MTAVALIVKPLLLAPGVWLSAFIRKIAAIIGASTTRYGAGLPPVRAGN
jgi:hypothetical protein